MIRHAAFLIASFLFALPAVAQTFPALHDVVKVASNDVLNIRRSPSAAADIIGNFAPEDTDIEVITTDPTGKWGMVNIGESSGWASMRFLRRSDNDPDYILTQRFQCFGTEPFWSLDVTQGQSALYSTPSSEDRSLSAGLVQTAINRSAPLFLGLGNGHAAIIRHEACSDGMSDRAFGLSVNFLVPDDGLSLMTGCCSIEP